MTTRLLTIAGCVLFCSGCCCALAVGAARQTARKTQTFAAPGVKGGFLVLETHNGSVNISAAAGGEITIKASLEARARSKSRAEALLAGTQVKVESTDGGTKITVEYPSTGATESVGVSFDVAVPPDTKVEASSHNGAIGAAGVEGDMVLRSHNGKIVAENIRGGVDAETRNGAITCNGASGPVRLTTYNGAVHVACAEGATAPDVVATTRNGGITFECGEGLSAALDLRTRNGSVSVSLPMKIESSGRSHIKAVVGEGEGKVTLETYNGGITVR